MAEKIKLDVLTKILDDRTPEKDAFGGHERVAKAIYELIQEEEEGGKAIALSGGFGSGKSTVIEFLKRIFSSKEKQTGHETGIFVFDAWEHQGNPLRRAFIEKYIDFLRNEIEWSGKNEWKEELELVSKSREDIKTTTEPYLTTLGSLFALFVLLMPLGLGLFRAGLMAGSHWSFFWGGLLLLVLPFIHLVTVYICWRPYFPKQRNHIKQRLNLKNFRFRDFFIKNRPPFHRKRILNFFSKKSREKIKSTSFKSPDPTTIEFQEIFDRISRGVLNNKKRRLIIVVDNIDRLTTESSINAWTTLQTFFEKNNTNSDWKKQFWLIAPFDVEELKNLWSGLHHLKNSGNNDANSTRLKTAEYVQAFLDKTFQILFRVPQPVLSDWKDYFTQQLCFAFPSIKKEDRLIFNDIATLYQLGGIEKNESPTPRDIKQFINRVSALYRIWHEKDIKLSTLTYYELIADKEEKFVESLKENKLIDATSRFLIDEKELNRKLAAVHFNCEIDRAYQVLYGNQIGNALQEGTAKGLKNYFDTDGFMQVLGSEYYPRLGQGIPLTLANCALCLREIEQESDHNLHIYFKNLADSFKSLVSIKPISDYIGRGISTIWEKNGFDEDWMEIILRKISHKEVTEKEITIEIWYSAMEPIFECLHNQSGLHLLKENLELPNGAEEYITLMSLINNSEKGFKDEIVKHLKTSATQDQIVEKYSNLLQSEDIPDNLGETLYLQTLAENGIFQKEDWDWSKLTDQISNLVKVNGSTRTDQIEAALKMMLVLRFKYEGRSSVNLSADQNFHNGLLFLINSQSDKRLLALLVLNSILFNPENQKNVNENNVNKGHNLLNNILSKPDDKDFIKEYFLNYIIEFHLLEEFFRVQKGNNILKQLSIYTIDNSFKLEEALDQINAHIVFEYFHDIHKVVDEEILLRHIETLFEREDNLVNLIIDEFETIPISYEEHFIFAKACPDASKQSYFEFLIEGYRNLEKEVWLNNLKDETELFQLAILIQKEGFDLGLSVKFKDALEEHYKQVYAGEINPPNEDKIKEWDSLLDALDNDIKSAFLKNIKFYLEKESSGTVSKVGQLYDAILISEGIYLNEADRFISNVFTRVLKSKDEEELTWLKELIIKQPEILKQNKSATKAFKAEVKHLELGGYSDVTSKIVEEIAKILKVDRNENNNED